MTETVTAGATATQIYQNPFFVLGASTRDDRRRILELADQRSLEIDDDVCQKARSQLTSPRQRLTAEIAWLPGISPRKAAELQYVGAGPAFASTSIGPAHSGELEPRGSGFW